jgi:predicted RNase H-like HicB family nuclease
MITNFLIKQYEDCYVAQMDIEQWAICGHIVADGQTRDELMHNVYDALKLQYKSGLYDQDAWDMSIVMPQPIIAFYPEVYDHAAHS